MDLFQIETSEPVFAIEAENGIYPPYPWHVDVRIYCSGEKPIYKFYQYVGEKAGFLNLEGVPREKGKPILVWGTEEIIPHDQQQLVLIFGWEINGKLEKGEVVYKITTKYKKKEILNRNF